MKIPIRDAADDIQVLAALVKNSQEVLSIPGAFGGVPANIYETDMEYQIDLLAPGFEKEDFIVELDEDGILTIQADPGDPANEYETVLKEEFLVAGFTRRFRVPDDVPAEEMEIFYESGVLTVLLPKDV